MRKLIPFLALATVLSFAACDSLAQALGAHKNAVARAAGHELTVDQAASLLKQNPTIPAQPPVVEALANLWVDYTLLATAANEDSTLKSINMQPLVKPALDQQMVFRLRDKVIHVDTAISDVDLQKLYDQQSPGMQVRARHILFSLPPNASPTQRDSVMKLAQSVRGQLAADGGKDFAQLAQKYSADTQSAKQGGELGFFSKGQMVAPFEQAAFALQPGQISNIVETPFGLHIIQVEEKKATPFDQVKAQFRQQAIGARMQQAEQAYVSGLTDTMSIKVTDGAYDVVRDLAKKPGMKLSGRAADRALVNYKGGAYSADEAMDLIRSLPTQQRTAFSTAPDDQLKDVLTGLAKNEILVGEAKRMGFAPTKTQEDSLTNLARTQLKGVVAASGLANIKPASGESKDQAIEKKVDAVLTAVVKGEQNVIPLGPLAYSLREQYSGQVYDRAYPVVVAKVQAARPLQVPQAPNPVPVPTTPPATTPSVAPSQAPAPAPTTTPKP